MKKIVYGYEDLLINDVKRSTLKWLLLSKKKYQLNKTAIRKQSCLLNDTECLLKISNITANKRTLKKSKGKSSVVIFKLR